jgi:hypothetical protein
VRLNCFSVGWVLDFVIITACSGFSEKKKEIRIKNLLVTVISKTAKI